MLKGRREVFNCGDAWHLSCLARPIYDAMGAARGARKSKIGVGNCRPPRASWRKAAAAFGAGNDDCRQRLEIVRVAMIFGRCLQL